MSGFLIMNTNGMFFDEKTAGIEFIHHGVRTVTGGAVRLQEYTRAVGFDSKNDESESR